MSLAGSVAIGCFVWVLHACASPAPALAASPTRIGPFDAKGNRTGSAVVAGDRVDLFDTHRNRIGSARIEDGRRVDFFDTRGNRTGSGRI